MLNDMDFESHWANMKSDDDRMHFIAQQTWKLRQKFDKLPCQQKEGENCLPMQTLSVRRLAGACGLGGLGGAVGFAIVWVIGKIEQWW